MKFNRYVKHGVNKKIIFNFTMCKNKKDKIKVD